MSRIYDILECGCMISCDGGGGLISGCDEDKNCKVQEYMDEHKFCPDCNQCLICFPDEHDECNQGG